jgi:hypothetical protein
MAVIGQSGQLHRLEKGTRYNLKRRLDGPRTSMDAVEKGKKFLALRRIEQHVFGHISTV